MLGAASWPAAAGCQASGDASISGGGAISSCLVAEVGNAGGLLGGGGMRELLLVDARETKTKVLPGFASSLEYSQHGRTLCPDGAVSNW